MTRPPSQFREIFQPLDNGELLGLWSALMSELRERGVIRSGNNPIGDYCEFLVAAHYQVEPEAGSTAGHDLVTADGVRVQVKARRLTQDGKLPPHYSTMRNLDSEPPPFDVLVALILNLDFSVRDAWEVSIDAVRRHACYRAHVNGWVLPTIRGVMFDDPEIKPLELRGV